MPLPGKKTGSIDLAAPSARSHTTEFDFKSPGPTPDAGTPVIAALRIAVG